MIDAGVISGPISAPRPPAAPLSRSRHGVRAASLLLLLFLLPFVACSDSDQRTGSSGVAVADTEPVTVTWSYWGDAWESQANQRVLRAFEREHPGIKVAVQHRPWSEYFTWLRTEWAAGRSPDVMFIDQTPYYAGLGELEPLGGKIIRDNVNLSDFYPALLDRFRYRGEVYGLPRDNDTKVIFYNRDHFAAAGIPEPVDGWTWDDLRRAALALSRRPAPGSPPAAPGPRYGFGFEPNWWQLWLWQRGCELPRRSGAVDQLDAAGCVEALTFLQNLIHTDRVTPPVDQLTSEAMSALFREGRLSMMFGNHALVPALTEADGLSWDVAPLPDGGARANVAGGAGFVVSRRAANKDAAWQLVKFLTGPKAQAIYAESGVVTPARRSVREDNIFRRQQPYRIEVFLAETELGRSPVDYPEGTAAGRLIDETLQAVMGGERSPEDALRALGPRLKTALEELGW